MGIEKVISGAEKYLFNSNGSALVLKNTASKIENAFMYGIRVPQKADTFDYVKIAHNFNPEKCYTEIVAFKDKCGKLIHKVITKHDGDQFSKTVRQYKKMKKDFNFIDRGGDDVSFYSINPLKIETLKFDNNGLVKKALETRSVADLENAKPVVTRTKIETIPSGDGDCVDIHSICEYKNRVQPKFFSQEVARMKDGEVLSFEEPFSRNVSVDINDPFLAIRLYDEKTFSKVIAKKIMDLKGLFGETKLYSDSNTLTRGFYKNGSTNINRAKVKTRAGMVKTAGHEVEHFIQDDLMHNCPESAEVKLIKDAFTNYVRPNVNFEQYWSNYAEKMARKAGSDTLRTYEDYGKKLQAIFPYATNKQLGNELTVDFKKAEKSGDFITDFLGV